MKIGISGQGNGLGKDLLMQILDKGFSSDEAVSSEDMGYREHDLSGLVICADVGEVHEFAMHFRNQIVGIIFSPEIQDIQPLSLGVVYGGDKGEVQNIIDSLRLDLDEILGSEHNIGIDLLDPNDLKKKRILVSGGESIISASDLVHVIKARKDDDILPYLQKDSKDWMSNRHESIRSQIRSTNSRFKPRGLRKK